MKETDRVGKADRIGEADRLIEAGKCCMHYVQVGEPDRKGHVFCSLNNCPDCDKKTFCLKLINALEDRLNLELNVSRVLQRS